MPVPSGHLAVLLAQPGTEVVAPKLVRPISLQFQMATGNPIVQIPFTYFRGHGISQISAVPLTPFTPRGR
jgi:hypothetical protein